MQMFLGRRLGQGHGEAHRRNRGSIAMEGQYTGGWHNWSRRAHIELLLEDAQGAQPKHGH